jgi:hypothetical protein
MSYLDAGKPVEQLGSKWLAAQRAAGRHEAIVEATTAGALADLMAGKDADGCEHCGGTGKRQ